MARGLKRGAQGVYALLTMRLGAVLDAPFFRACGAALGALASARVPEPVLMAAFATLLVVVGAVMVTRLVRGRGSADGHRPGLDDPIITFSPTFFCNCPQALKVLVTATVVGLLTGFLGVGGGFLVVACFGWLADVGR